MTHKCNNLVVTCIDFRFQETIDSWISQNLEPKSFDRVAYAGSVKNIDVILPQIDISKKLHNIKKVILINHEDCGAYGEEGTMERHSKDLIKAKEKILAKYPDLKVDTYYLNFQIVATEIK